MRLVQIIVGVAVVLAPLGWFVLQEYQKQRILVFLNPNIDPLGPGITLFSRKSPSVPV